MSEFDVLIRNATIVDGTGAPARRGNVAIRGDRVVGVGDINGDAAQTLDVEGKVACPGFIDPHCHADLNLLKIPTADNLVMQGITTFVGGNCGLSLAPFGGSDYSAQIKAELGIDAEWPTFGRFLELMERMPASVNYVPMVGHNAIRQAVMGADFKRRATPSEVSAMRLHADEAMGSGCWGLTVGLDSSPGDYASTDEIVSLAEVARAHGGLFDPHTRHTQSQWPAGDSEEYGYGLYHGPMEDVYVGRYRGYREAVEVARRTGIRLNIAHLSNAYCAPAPHLDSLEAAMAESTLSEIIDKPRAEGLDVTFDVLGFSGTIAPQVPMTTAFGKWLALCGSERLVELLKGQDLRTEIKRTLRAGRLKIGMIHPLADPYWTECFRITRCADASLVGRTLAEIVDARRQHPVDVIADIVVRDPATLWVQFADKRITAAALDVLIRHPLGMPCADTFVYPGVNVDSAGRGAAAIFYGLFPYYIGHFVREAGLLTLEDAVRKATSLPAQVFGIPDRGVLRAGASADVLVFDPKTIRMTGDWARPVQIPDGIEHVLVNGRMVWEGKAHTGATPGKVLRKG